MIGVKAVGTAHHEVVGHAGVDWTVEQVIEASRLTHAKAQAGRPLRMGRASVASAGVQRTEFAVRGTGSRRDFTPRTAARKSPPRRLKRLHRGGVAIAALRLHVRTLIPVDAEPPQIVGDRLGGLDVVVSGSQKAFMLPPGLAFIGVSERAQRFMETSTCSHYYFDLKAELAVQPNDQTAFTPAIGLMLGLDEALKIILDEEGLEVTWERTERLAAATREAMRAIGLELLAPDAPSAAPTAVVIPDGVDGPAFQKYLRERLGYTVADGQGHLKGKIFRIAHLGYFDRFDTIAAIAAIEMSLAANGYVAKLGEAARTATELLAD